MERLQGKTALITGAARGLGAAIARRFTDEGAKVIVNDLSLDAARSTAEKLHGHGVAAVSYTHLTPVSYTHLTLPTTPYV